MRYSLMTEQEKADKYASGFLMRDVIRFFLVNIILLLLLKLLLWLGIFPTPNAYVLSILGGKTILLLYLFWLIRDRRAAWPETGAATAGRWWAWPASILLYAACYPLLLYADKGNKFLMLRLYEYMGWVYDPAPQDVLVLIFSDILNDPVRAILVFFTIVAGPFMEELAFRGVGLDASRRAWGAAWAVAWTSLLFGLFHLSLNLLLPLSLLGAVFAVVRLMSRTLWCAVLVHCLHNAVTLFILADAMGRLDGWKFW